MTTGIDGKKYKTIYNLDATISIGYRVKSHRGVRFIIIDDIIYLCGSSIKDVGKKRFVLAKVNSIQLNELLKNI